MFGGPKLGLLVALARTRRRRIATSLLFSIAVGLVIITVVPLLFAFNSCGSSGDLGCWIFMSGLALVWSHFVMVPIAILVSAYAFYSCGMKLSTLADFGGLTSSGRPIPPPDLRPRTPMRKVFRAACMGWLILLAVWIGSMAAFAYWTNNVCASGYHIILSDADAITQAQKELHGGHGIRGYADDRFGVADFSQANCCKVKRARTGTGVIVWEVGLEGETFGEPKRYVSALLKLTNCGEVFADDSYVSTYPRRSN
jgi:hypothetical protein